MSDKERGTESGAPEAGDGSDRAPTALRNACNALADERLAMPRVQRDCTCPEPPSCGGAAVSGIAVIPLRLLQMQATVQRGCLEKERYVRWPVRVGDMALFMQSTMVWDRGRQADAGVRTGACL